MNVHSDWWACLNHGGLLISPSKISECFPHTLNPLPVWQAERLRRALTAFDGTNDSLTGLLDYMLQDLIGLPEQEWQKAQMVDAKWNIRSFTGMQIKPRRLWQGAHGETLPVFVPEDGASRQFGGRLGVGRSRQLLSRVVEWLRRLQQPLALVTNGRQWRLVHAGQDYDAWCEWDIDLWFEEGQPGVQATAWRQLLNIESLKAPVSGKGVLYSAIIDSRKGQAELSAVLGERVRQAVEELITASHGAIEQAKLAGNMPDYRDLYLAGTRIVMRCIITLFSEARSLLPVDNPIYQQAYSLEGLRQQLDRRAGGRGNERLTQGRSAWPRLVALFNLIYLGSAHEALPVPQYSGGLFEPGDAANQLGVSRALALLESNGNAVSDRQVLNILRLLTRTRIRVRQGHKNTWVDAPVDFSALSAEYIGILYEGLLDFELKQADICDPVLFLGVGNQPALTLSQLDSMDDKAIKQLFEALSTKEIAGGDDGVGEEGEESAVEEPPDASLEADSENIASDEEEPGADNPETAGETDAELALSADDMARAQRWLEHAAELAGLVKKNKGKKAANSDYEQDRARAAKQLCARLVAPGEFYLVRWGGTRKGAGTFYTRPQLAAPTVRRTLQPLAYLPVRSEINSRSGLEDVVEWEPKKPEEILALKVCDPAMGSGSFLAGALRYLTDALVQSLYHHKRIARRADGAVARLADGNASQGLGDELLRFPPEHEGFEDALRSQLKRHIVERCIYGVDMDPLAVELGRMALWVETMDRDLPFGFLDHKLKVGNSLVGCWFDTFRHYPAMAWEREGGDKDYQKDKPDNLINHYFTDTKGKKRGDVFSAAIKEYKSHVPAQLMAGLSGQLRLGEDITAEVHGELVTVFEELHQLKVFESDKRAKLYREKVLDNPRFHVLKARMDLWCALWFWPGNDLKHAPLPTNFAQPSEQALAIAIEVAARQHFFHWELEFPDVFTPNRAGFDALLGNPPWEIQKPNSKEFFSNIDPLYRAYGKQEALDKQLVYFRKWPAVEHDWVAYNAALKGMSNWVKHVGRPFGDRTTKDKDGKQKHDVNLGGRGKISFSASARLHKKWQQQRARDSSFADPHHIFLHQGSADINTYKMFLELGYILLRPSGRMGMIVPGGIYSDKGTSDLRELFLDQCYWEWLFGFTNREGIFDIHPDFKFCPLIIRKGDKTENVRVSFMHRDIDDWDQAEHHILPYPRTRVDEFSPLSKTILEIRSEQDLRVLQSMYRSSVLLGDRSESGWGISYAREFDMTNDSKLFPELPKWQKKGYVKSDLFFWTDGNTYALPVYNAKMFENWDFSSSGWVRGKGRGAVWEDIGIPKEIKPEYLMAVDDYVSNIKFRSAAKICFKDISTAIHQRTMMCTMLPDLPAVNASPVLNCGPSQNIELLQSMLASFSFDYVAKFKIGYLHLNYFIIEECPLIKPRNFQSNSESIRRFALSLGCAHESFAQYWEQCRPLFAQHSWRRFWALTDHERLRLKAMLDAVVALSYGLSLKDFEWILKDTDWPTAFILNKSNTRLLDQKRFWRVDKDKDPELRHTVLSLIAFHALQEIGLDAFLDQNDGAGWLLPETLCLADYGLGHDERAQKHQPVASRLGPRFYDWQLNEDIEQSWAECAAHVELIRRVVPPQDATEADPEELTKEAVQPTQIELI